MEDIFAKAGDQPPFVIICDNIEDPHNLGAIIRTAEAAGAHGVIIPKRRGVGLTATVAKTSAGAVEYMPVVRVANIVSTIEELKQKGLWIFCADMDGKPWCSADMGGADRHRRWGRGQRRQPPDQGALRLCRLAADERPGQLAQHASVAAAIVIYEAVRQRSGLPAFTSNK